MVGAHVVFQRFAVGAAGRFPSALFGGRVEIVGQVFGVGVSDLPAARQTCSLQQVSIMFTRWVPEVQRSALVKKHHDARAHMHLSQCYPSLKCCCGSKADKGQYTP